MAVALDADEKLQGIERKGGDGGCRHGVELVAPAGGDDGDAGREAPDRLFECIWIN